jgi:hypothetical protein
MRGVAGRSHRATLAVAFFALLCIGALPGAYVGLARPGVLAATGPAAASRASLAAAYGRLPLAFEPNRGQFDRRALFAARGRGYTLFLTHRQAVLSLAAGTGRRHGRTRSAVLRLGLVGASPRATLSPLRRLPGKVNYLLGNRRAAWHTDIPTYAGVRYQGLWPGIGAHFYGRGGRLEYDLNVAAGADPGRIGLSFGGARRLSLGSTGCCRCACPAAASAS